MMTDIAGAAPREAPEEPAPRSARRRRHTIGWTVGIVGFAIVVILGLVLGSQLGKDPTIIKSPLVGKPAPSFDLPLLDGGGRSVRSADLGGQIVVVNFWASWCVPCRQEAPDLEAFARRWSGRGVELVGIIYNDTDRNARAFRDEFRLTYPQVKDPGARAALDYGVFGVPETYVIDERGVVMAKILGRMGRGYLDDVIRKVSDGETLFRQPGDVQPGPGQ